MGNKLSRSAKAVVAFFVPMLSQLGADLQKGISPRELARNLLVSLLTSIVVWAVPNARSEEDENGG